MPEQTCPLCGGRTEQAFVTSDRNRGVTGDRFRYDRCTRCGSLHLVNVPDDLGPFYAGEYFVLPSGAQMDRVARAEIRTRSTSCERHAPSGGWSRSARDTGVRAARERRGV